ncbi:MAG: acyltransferase [Alphaproteobacteria bacterium]|nr:acyltransferase [Alphaproteobacteria bacterium]MCW5742290.1 acyltransferase [Alphaproteobacteria bacterium]
MTYLPALDGLRALAALWVVAFHATAFTGVAPPVIRHGYLGVDLFFVLSGFVLAHVYAPVFARDGMPFYARYLYRRVARLWPVWLAVLALFALKAEIGSWSGLGGGGLRLADDPGLWSLYALLMQSWGWADPERINPPGWSLSYEWAASLLLPLALAAAVRLRSPLICLALVLLSVAAHTLYTHLNGLPSLHTAAAHGGARVAAEFLAGVLMWRCWHQTDCAPASAGLLAGLCALLAIAAMAAFGPALWLDHLLIVLAAGVIGGVAAGRGRLAVLLSSRALRMVGAASYALYVVHWLVFESLWWAFDRLGLVVGTAAGWLFFGAMITLSLVAAFALHIVIERPARSTLRRLAEAEPAR